ncbi:Hypothetical protein A7982_11094 [Minicystis rosea]|nr:Hypothetical protein A7982_11094 [Minicystis rosea]
MPVAIARADRSAQPASTAPPPSRSAEAMHHHRCVLRAGVHELERSSRRPM